MTSMKKTQRMTLRRFLILLLAFIVLCVGGGVATSGYLIPLVWGLNKSVEAAKSQMVAGESVSMDLTALPQMSKIYAGDGKTLLAQFYTQNRQVVALKDISDKMQKAVVAREDRRFLDHSGIDPQGIARAFVNTYIKKGDTQGGSTLTQQYVKNVLMDQALSAGDPITAYHAREETISRKLREMLIAIQLEKDHSKAEILQGYLNIAQFGVNTYGVQTAAQRYFSKDAKDLNLREAATIAAVTKNPAHYDPTVDPEQSEFQRNIVLNQMEKYGFATPEEVKEAKSVSVKDSLHPSTVQIGCQTAGNAAYFCDYVVRTIMTNPVFGKTAADRRRLLYQGGLRIYTTLDVTAQNDAYNAMVRHLPIGDPSGLAIMMAAVRPGTGEILAMAQNRNYTAGGGDDNSTSINYSVGQELGGGTGFGIGSTFKPINLVAWMMSGRKITQPLRTSLYYPINSFACSTKKFGTWHVQNAFGTTVNPETPLHALNFSHNTTQASMGQIMGLCQVGKAMEALGYQNAMTSEQDVMKNLEPTMLIGTKNTSPLSMATTYATIAARGKRCTPIAISKMYSPDGKEMKIPSANCTQTLDPDLAETAAYAMNKNVTAGIANMAQLADGRMTYAKTGTNEDISISGGGFIPQLSAFVLVSNPKGYVPIANMRINGVYRGYWDGANLPIPAWKDFMDTYIRDAHIPADNSLGKKPSSKYF